MIPVEAASPAVTFTSSRNIRLLMTATLAAGIAYAGHELFEDRMMKGLAFLMLILAMAGCAAPDQKAPWISP
jgi:hypothetical protein